MESKLNSMRFCGDEIGSTGTKGKAEIADWSPYRPKHIIANDNGNFALAA